MCIFYLTLALIWLVYCALHWKNLLRIQFWIGGVILLGMVEKAFFYFEYNEANENGFSSLSLALIAELVRNFILNLQELYLYERKILDFLP